VEIINIGDMPFYGYQFIGIIDTGVAGFRYFSICESSGKIGQKFLMQVDDVTVGIQPVAGNTIPASQILDNQRSRVILSCFGCEICYYSLFLIIFSWHKPAASMESVPAYGKMMQKMSQSVSPSRLNKLRKI
jgi:hypothetical protein